MRQRDREQLIRTAGRVVTVRPVHDIEQEAIGGVPESTIERGSRLLGVPTALVSLVDADRQFFAARRVQEFE